MADLLRLRYGPVMVGEIADPFIHQGTWFGSFRRSVENRGSPIAERAGEFIEFCKRWHDRLDSGEDPDASEFDRFNDLMSSGLWTTEDQDGTVSVVDQVPIFYSDEITWGYADQQPGPRNP